jgi:hypothetical protein
VRTSGVSKRTKSAFLSIQSPEYHCNPFVQLVLSGEGLVFKFVRVVSSVDGPVSHLDSFVPGPDGLVSNLVPVAESGGDAAQ